MTTKGKGGKDVEAVAALKAFETTFKASCRHHGVAAVRGVLEQLQQHLETTSPLTRVVVSGSSVQGEHVQAVAECLASYSRVHTLTCLNCATIGDKGLNAVAALLRASGSRWWQGSRLQELEVIGEGRVASSNMGNASSCCDSSYQPSGLTGGIRRPGTAPAAATIKQPEHTGICPPLPAHLQPEIDPDSSDNRYVPVLRLLHYKLKAPRPMLEVRAWALAPTLGASAGQHGRSAPTTPQAQIISCSLPEKVACFSSSALKHLGLSLGVANLQLKRLVLDHTFLGDEGLCILATGLGRCSNLCMLSMRYCGIGPLGIQQLAAALQPSEGQAGTEDPSLRVPAPTSSSSTSSRRPQTTTTTAAGSAVSKQREAKGAKAAASTVCTCSGSAGSPCLPSSQGPPKLSELHVSGNLLGTSGLLHLSKALRCMSGLQVLGLADIALDEPPSAGVQGLVHGLLASPSNLHTLDFADNIIGAGSAAYLLSLAKAKPSLVLMKLTPRVSSDIMSQLSSVLDEHLKAARASPKPRKQPPTSGAAAATA